MVLIHYVFPHYSTVNFFSDEILWVYTRDPRAAKKSHGHHSPVDLLEPYTAPLHPAS